ncbi:MAG: metal ABC transporter ATP-binding protein [bacterium]|nr:metal ABC transporter ATP-binding protein [bacterium]
MNLFEIRNMWYQFDDRWILEDINLVIRDKIVFTVVGPNGSGKTTLIKLMVGLLRPQRGRILYKNKDIMKLSPEEFRVGYVPQLSSYSEISQRLLLPVSDVIRLSMLRNKENIKVKIDRVLEMLQIEDLRNELFLKLSGGQKQKVLLARALANEPETLILDEPVTGVDQESEFHIFNFLKQLNRKEKITIILVTHDLDVVPGISDKVGCLDKRLYVHNKGGEFISCPVYKNQMKEGLEILVHGKNIPHRLVPLHRHGK